MSEPSRGDCQLPTQDFLSSPCTPTQAWPVNPCQGPSLLTEPGEGGLNAQKRKRSEEEASEIAGWPQGRAIPAGEPLTVSVEGTREGSHVTPSEVAKRRRCSEKVPAESLGEQVMRAQTSSSEPIAPPYAPSPFRAPLGGYRSHLTVVVPAHEDSARSFREPLPQPQAAVCRDTTFNPEQQQVIDAVVRGKNVFFTGPAGTGKSVVIRHILKLLRGRIESQTNPNAVAVTASTGMAACNIGGITVQKWAGLGVAVTSLDKLFMAISERESAKKRWMEAVTLVIEEISMLSAETFDNLVGLSRRFRDSDHPSGGIQFVLCGDFFQLPPVTPRGVLPRYAFESQHWEDVVEESFILRRVLRQKDPRLSDVLNEVRVGDVSSQAEALLKSLSREIDTSDGREPIQLYAVREAVDAANAEQLRRLSGEPVIFEARDEGSLKGQERDRVFDKFAAPRALCLKVDAKVMLIKNKDDTLVNGSVGTVLEFRTLAKHYQDTLDPALYQAMAALGLARADASEFPLVRFNVYEAKSDTWTTRDVLVDREDFTQENADGEILASRSQLPLELAWAMSIHKAQGQTMQRVRVDLGRVFANGQAYVALSRATSIDGLQVVNFAKGKVKVSPIVLKWWKDLEARIQARECP